MKQAGYGGGIHGFGLPDWAVEGALRVSPAAIKALTPKFLGECGESTVVYGQQGRHKYKVAHFMRVGHPHLLIGVYFQATPPPPTHQIH